MKILVFNGSPKKEKSDTMHITRAFLAGMNELAPQEVQTVEVADRSIAFCRGCFACKYNGGHCRIDDDMGEILKQMLASDLLLFSFPLYCYGMPAMLKNLIDRTLPLSSMASAGGGGRDRAPAGADPKGRAAVCRDRRDRRGAAGGDQRAHDPGGALCPDRKSGNKSIRKSRGASAPRLRLSKNRFAGFFSTVWLRPAGRFRQIFAKIWRVTVFFPGACP